MTDITYDLGEIEACANTMRSEQEIADSDSTTTSTTVSDAGVAWGADEAGQAFAGIYLDGASEAMAAVLHSPKQLGQLADNLDQTAKLYGDGNEKNLQAIREVLA